MSVRRKRKAKDVAEPLPSAETLRRRLQAVSGVQRKTAADAGFRSAEAIVTGSGRAGRKAIAIYMQPIAKEQLDRIAHEQRKSIQALGIEALNLLFRHYDQKPIA